MRNAFEPLWGVGNVHSALLAENDVDRKGKNSEAVHGGVTFLLPHLVHWNRYADRNPYRFLMKVKALRSTY
jgi:hypothetical protein